MLCCQARADRLGSHSTTRRDASPHDPCAPENFLRIFLKYLWADVSLTHACADAVERDADGVSAGARVHVLRPRWSSGSDRRGFSLRLLGGLAVREY